MKQLEEITKLQFEKFKVIRDEVGLDLIGIDRTQELNREYPLLRQLVRDGKVGETLGSLAVPVDILWDEALLESDSLDFLSDVTGVDPFRGATFVDLKGDFTSSDCKFELKFPGRFTPLGPVDFFATVIQDPFIAVEGVRYLLSPSLRSALRLVNQANRSWPTWSQTQRYHFVSDLKSLSNDGDIHFSGLLASIKVIKLERPSIDVERIAGTDKLELVLDSPIPDSRVGSFRDVFDRNRQTRDVYTVDDPQGGYHKVLVDPIQKKVLDDIKRMPPMTEEELGEFIQSPPEEWDDELVDASRLFSDRVIGLGVFKARAYPFISQYRSQWIPGIELDGFGHDKVLIDTEDKLAELDEAIEQAKRAGNDEVRYRNKSIPLADAANVAAVARKQLKTPETKVEVGQDRHKAESVITKDNVEGTTYIQLGELIPNEFPFVPVSGLRADIVLKPYQQEGVNWLVGLFASGVPGAVLADDMGLGKTLQVLSALQVFSKRGRSILGLVVAPISLLQNWTQEAKKFFPDSDIEMIVGNQNPAVIESIMRQPIRYENTVLLISYEYLRMNITKLATIGWTIVIFDEAQTIKNPGSLVTNAARGLKAEFRVAITGTPVENSFVDLWCIVDIVHAGYLDSAKEFVREFGAEKDDKEDDILRKGRALREKLGNLLLRRLKAHVLNDLPRKIEHTEPDVMPRGQENIYDQVLFDALKLGAAKPKQTLDIIFRLRKLSDHPLLLSDQTEWYEGADTDSAKLLVLRQVLDRVKVFNEKCLVFAEYRRTQQILARIFRQWYDLNVDIVNGDSPTAMGHANSRVAVIDRFQEAPGFGLLILSPRAAGVGLNITGANHVVHYSRHWNPAKEEQATDRAYRIGQSREVHVWYPISLHSNPEIFTFDQTLAELLSHKKSLKDAVLVPRVMQEVNQDDLYRSIMGREKTKT